MSREEQEVAFGKGLDSLIKRFAGEFDLSYTFIIGALTLKTHLLAAECMELVSYSDCQCSGNCNCDGSCDGNCDCKGE